MNYKLTFPIFSKVNVNWPYQSNLFKYLILEGEKLNEIHGD